MMKRLLCLLSAVLFLVVTGMIALGARSVWKDPAPASSPQISTAPKRKRQPASTAAQTWLLSLTLREKVAQLIFVPFTGSAPSTRSHEYQRVARLVRDAKVGGLVLVNWTQGRVTQRAEPYALAAFVNRMQKLAQVPLLVSGDFERGASMRVNGVTAFPHAMAFGAADDIDLTRRQGEITAREARALGVHWVFHPVADVNNNPDNPIINIRSFGEDPVLVSRHVAAFIHGAQSALSTPVLTSAKHFPGHGDTAVDTHLKLATISLD
jgi:beta-N-acetylhexosaminidase